MPIARMLLLSSLLSSLVGCTLEHVGAAGAGAGDADPDDPRDPNDPDDPDEPAPNDDGAFGIVIVDVQDTFVSGAANDDIDGILARTAELFEIGQAHAIPFFITFEASDTGDHRLHPSLQPLEPEHATRHIKTTFDANGLASFADALAASGLRRFVIVGSETDVCVLQTVLGSRRAGYSVLLAQDAVFSSEPNVGPALRRMTQEGVALVSVADVRAFAEGTAAPPPLSTPSSSSPQAVPRALPGQVGIVLNHLVDDTVASSSDPWRSQKLARLRELLLISEWFDVPLYGSNPDAAPSPLPTQLQGVLSKQILPLSQIDAGVTQLVVAGTDDDVAALVDAQRAASRTLFLMDDAIVASAAPSALRAYLDARYDDGDVPITYKSFYYEMTATVAFEDWPADWIERDAEYYDRTVAPESLPPIAP